MMPQHFSMLGPKLDILRASSYNDTCFIDEKTINHSHLDIKVAGAGIHRNDKYRMCIAHESHCLHNVSMLALEAEQDSNRTVHVGRNCRIH